MIIIDSGLHIWRAPTAERPWMPGRTAHLPEPIGYEDLRDRMLEAGVHRAISDPAVLGRRQLGILARSGCEVSGHVCRDGADPDQTSRKAGR